MTPFDLVILTAANPIQAEGYQARLQWRKKRGLYPETEFMVIADPDGQRIGSGGSTLYVLRQLYKRAKNSCRRAFNRKRILIIHSGGDSRRLPAYSSCGKIFTPLPTKKYDCLFDIMMEGYSALPFCAEGQVIITSGDVLLNFDAELVYFADHGITGVAYPDDVQTAGRHGVFVPSGQTYHHPARVKNFLQKPSPLELQNHHALDYHQRAWVDTGIVHLAQDATETLVHCSRLLSKTLAQKTDLNLYQHIPFALLKKIKIPDAERLAKLPFHVCLLPYCGFFHIGRSQEFLHNLYTLTHAGAQYGFENGIRSNVAHYPQFKKAFIYNCLVQTATASVTGPALIENCIIDDSIILAGENIVTGLQAHSGPLQLDHGIGLTLLPLKENRWTAIIYGLQDHFKAGPAPDKDLFMNQPISEWLQKRGLAIETLWPKGEKQDLWNACLFPVCDEPAAAVQIATSLQKSAMVPEKWLAVERRSMQNILQTVDHDIFQQRQERIENGATLQNLEKELTPDASWTADRLLKLCSDEKELSALTVKIAEIQAGSTDLLFNSRLNYLQARVLLELGKSTSGQQPQADRLMDRAFATIRTAVGKAFANVLKQNHQGIAIRSDEVVWACSPARLDFAGGWSDTPPYCMEQGGTVLNAAVTLNGQYPIQVIAKIHSQPFIRVNSIDLGSSKTINDFAMLRDFTDPSDWLSLPKAAFHAAGIFSGQERVSLASLLKKQGGGIDLTLFSALPAGSGLGTSSILGAATIAALSRMFGLTLSLTDLFQRTSFMEQLMTTGGGWQDQIGGVLGGVKLIETRPGYDQSPTLSWTQLTEAGHNQTLLYYTGLRRMAKNILRQVVSRYLDRDPEAVQTLAQLKSLAYMIKNALDHRQTDLFGNLISQVWDCNKRLDQGSTTEAIESLIASIAKQIHGVKLLGAGGGGFLFIVAKSGQDREKIKKRLTQNPMNDRARFFDFAIDPIGLRVNVL